MRRLALVVWCALVLGSGCVTRTVQGDRRMLDADGLKGRREIGKNGAVVETKTVWFWEKQFWR